MYRRFIKGICFLVLGTILLFSASQAAARHYRPRPRPRPRNEATAVVKTSLIIENYEFGPGVAKILLETNRNLEEAELREDTAVTTAGISRQVTDLYLSDAQGNPLDDDESRYVALELDVSYNVADPTQSASPFVFDLASFRNYWVSSYVVKVEGLALEAADRDDEEVISSEQEAVNNRLTPTADRFAERGSSALPYAAYQPSSSSGREQTPLIVWLHGAGEAGTDMNFPLLANEVVNLTQETIQAQFTATGSSRRSGAHVLVPQSPTPWVESGGSQYAAAVIETIDAYLARHPDVDPDRIYLAGVSSGGAMTVEMGVAYPDYFAALIPIAATYPYQADGDNYSLEPARLAALKDQPIWLVHTAADTSTPAAEGALPFYKALIASGAENKWLSYFETASGTDLPGTVYDGHWAWIYFFNNQVTGVQNTHNVATMSGLTGMVATDPTQGGDAQATVNGRSYNNIFAWMNAQTK